MTPLLLFLFIFFFFPIFNLNVRNKAFKMPNILNFLLLIFKIKIFSHILDFYFVLIFALTLK